MAGKSTHFYPEIGHRELIYSFHPQQHALLVLLDLGKFYLGVRMKSFTFVLIPLLALSACTGAGSSTKTSLPINGEGTFSKTENPYYREEGDGSVTVITVGETGEAKNYIWKKTTGLISLAGIPKEKLVVSVDGKYLTVVGQPGIYEFQNIPPTNLGQEGTIIPSSSIEALCIASPISINTVLGNTPFKELHILKENGGYRFTAIGSKGEEILGDQVTPWTKSETSRYEIYANPSFGSFTVDLLSPLHNQMEYNATAVSAPTVPLWDAMPNLYCHGNREGFPNPLVSTSALTVEHSGGWTNANGALVDDGEYATSVLAQTSDALKLEGFFARPEQSLPTGALINGIYTKCRMKSHAAGEEMRINPIFLMKDGVKSGSSYQALINYVPLTWGSKFDFGSAVNTWSTTWTKAQVNAPGFGLSIQFQTDVAPSGSIDLDFCYMAVYWRIAPGI